VKRPGKVEEPKEEVQRGKAKEKKEKINKTKLSPYLIADRGRY